MTLKQFRSWLEGFREGIDEGEPLTVRQFNRITDKLELELDHEPMDFGPFLHRYYTPYAEIWNELASEDRGEPATVDPGFVERLMHRNSHAIWKIAGRCEYLSITRAEKETIPG